jgi:heme/copper-type cytochrome/quinol oxidase subunit 2
VLNLLPFTPVYAQGIQPWGDCVTPEGVPTLKCLEVVFGNIIFMSSAFIVLVLFVMFVIGAFRYLTSFGNAEKMKKAKGTLTYALVGFILFISAFLILKIIDVIFLGGKGTIFQFNIGD